MLPPPPVVAPPGQGAPKILRPLMSRGGENFFNYDGAWKDGMMNGNGRYVFADGSTYDGDWVDNRPHETGETTDLG